MIGTLKKKTSSLSITSQLSTTLGVENVYKEDEVNVNSISGNSDLKKIKEKGKSQKKKSKDSQNSESQQKKKKKKRVSKIEKSTDPNEGQEQEQVQQGGEDVSEKNQELKLEIPVHPIIDHQTQSVQQDQEATEEIEEIVQNIEQEKVEESIIVENQEEDKIQDQELNQQLSECDSFKTCESISKIDTELKCSICLEIISEEEKFSLQCNHTFCKTCLSGYYSLSVNEGKSEIQCPLPDCKHLVTGPLLLDLIGPESFVKWEKFSVRKALSGDPHIRFCPAPNCDYAVFIKVQDVFGYQFERFGCRDSVITCQSPTCGMKFCGKCGAKEHPNLSCNQSQELVSQLDGNILESENVKPCPKCNALICKLDDGTCNHMVCSVCGTNFCWLCLKEINDLHFFGPSGCTFYAKKSWGMGKKTLVLTGIGISAPVAIGLLSVAAVPTITVAVPVHVYKKMNKKYYSTPTKRNFAIGAGVTGSILAGPLIAAGLIAVGVPVLILGTYIGIPGVLIHEQVRNTKLKKERKKLIKSKQQQQQTQEISSQ